MGQPTASGGHDPQRPHEATLEVLLTKQLDARDDLFHQQVSLRRSGPQIAAGR
jgi:hypothetical protein